MSATSIFFWKILPSYFRSLLFVAVMVTFAIFFLMVTDVINVDFFNINPHRSKSHAASLPFLFAPIFLILSTLGIFITFSIAQIVQAMICSISIQKFCLRGYFIIATTTPLMAILSWYCYDYLTPSDFNFGFNEGADWVPYQHGLTMQRLLIVLGLQSFVTIFSIVRLRFEIGGHNLANKKFLFAAVGFASIIGIGAGILKTQSNVAAQSPNMALKSDWPEMAQFII